MEEQSREEGRGKKKKELNKKIELLQMGKGIRVGGNRERWERKGTKKE